MVYPNGEIGILESKGTVSADPSSLMFSGHEQCEDGKKYFTSKTVKVKNSYVSAVSFATTSSRMKRNTKIYYADPSGDVDSSGKDTTKDRLYEYSKFFYLAGNKEAYKKLREGKKLDKQGIYYPFDINNEGIIAQWLIDNTHFIELGISKELETYLCNPGKPVHGEVYQSDGVEHFSDGTFIKLVSLKVN